MISQSALSALQRGIAREFYRRTRHKTFTVDDFREQNFHMLLSHPNAIGGFFGALSAEGLIGKVAQRDEWKEILLKVIDGVRAKIERHTIGDVDLEYEKLHQLSPGEDIDPVHSYGDALPVWLELRGVSLSLKVSFLDPERINLKEP